MHSEPRVSGKNGLAFAAILIALVAIAAVLMLWVETTNTHRILAVRGLHLEDDFGLTRGTLKLGQDGSVMLSSLDSKGKQTVSLTLQSDPLVLVRIATNRTPSLIFEVIEQDARGIRYELRDESGRVLASGTLPTGVE